jgi:hypothetical protein
LFDCYGISVSRKSLKIPKKQLEMVNRKCTDSEMAKRKKNKDK